MRERGRTARNLGRQSLCRCGSGRMSAMCGPATLLNPRLGLGCSGSLHHWIIILPFPGVLRGHQKHRFVCRVFLIGGATMILVEVGMRMVGWTSCLADFG